MMNNDTNFRLKIFNILFLLFFLSLLSVFFVNLFSHYGYESFQISEFLINYQGGFVRRGLLGEGLFFFTKYFGLDVEWTIKIISAFCCFAVCAFFVKAFLKKGYTLYLLPLCFFCGGIIMTDSWIRKDFLMLGVFILSLLIFNKKALPLFLRIILINLLTIFILLTHEVSGFYSLPILGLLLMHSFLKDKKIIASAGLSFISLLPAIFVFVVVMFNHGDREMSQVIWDSWNILTHKEMTSVPSLNAIGAIGWPSKGTFQVHFNLNFLAEEYYLLSTLYWLIVFPVVYYISTNALLVFKNRPEIYTENHRTNLSAILLFQFVCLLPLFICLSADYIRIFFYLTASSFALFLIVPDKVAACFPNILIRLVTKINKGLDRILPPSKTTVGFLMLTIGISYTSFLIKTIWMSTMIYRILLLFSQPIILLKHYILNLS
jgi:hypothetical protein